MQRDFNPNLAKQIRVWQILRRKKSEDPCDWAAFREHAQYIYAPDPGETPPDYFKREEGVDDG